MNYRFKVQDLISVCEDMYIYISGLNKVTSDGSEIIYWQGWTDDYFDKCPYGEYEVKHISSWGTKKRTVNYPHGAENIEFNVMYIQIEMKKGD